MHQLDHRLLLKTSGGPNKSILLLYCMERYINTFKETKQHPQKKGCGGKAIYGKETFICFKTLSTFHFHHLGSCSI